jgi:hypothetical protein
VFRFATRNKRVPSTGERALFSFSDLLISNRGHN